MSVLIALVFLVSGVLGILGKLPPRSSSQRAATRNQRRIGFLLLAVGIVMLALVAKYPQR